MQPLAIVRFRHCARRIRYNHLESQEYVAEVSQDCQVDLVGCLTMMSCVCDVSRIRTLVYSPDFNTSLSQVRLHKMSRSLRSDPEEGVLVRIKRGCPR